MYRDTEEQIINLLSDSNQHSWNSICEKIDKPQSIITTVLVGLLDQEKIDYYVNQINIFYFLKLD